MEFTTDSDCEVLLHLYKEHGPDFLTKVFVNGMFAFILYDECNDVFVVARDPIGIIPLYVGSVSHVAAGLAVGHWIHLAIRLCHLM